MLARIEARRLLRELGIEALFIQTVHDSIVVDCPSKNVDQVTQCLKQAVEAVPQFCYEQFGYEFGLPLTCEIQVGKNKLDMKELV